jgi:predicted MPP superfamily phosphohydrolase
MDVKTEHGSGQMTRRGLLRASVRLGIGGSAAMAGGAWWSRAEPHWFEVENHEFTLPRLPIAFDGFRIVHLSDFHVDASRVITGERLREIVARINALRPDAVLLTGDYVTVNGRHWAEEFGTGMQGITAPVRAAVMGNHDYWSGVGRVREALHKCRVRELLNNVWTLRRGGAALHLCGLDDLFGKPALRDVTRLVPRGECAVLLHHQPDTADRVSETGVFDLQLSGHSHGGQVRLPGIGALQLPHGAMRYPMGHYRIGQMQLYTTRGIGTLWGIRFNCRPEITHITLRAV